MVAKLAEEVMKTFLAFECVRVVVSQFLIFVRS